MPKLPLTPLADYIVVQQEAAKTKTASGLLLPESAAADKPKIAKVLAVGPAVRDVVEGDRVVFGGYSNTDVKVDGVEYMLVKNENIYAKVEV